MLSKRHFRSWNSTFMYAHCVPNSISKWRPWIQPVVLLKAGLFWNSKLIRLKHRWIELENFNSITKVYFCFVHQIMDGRIYSQTKYYAGGSVWIRYAVIRKHIDLTRYSKEIVWIFLCVDKEGTTVEFGDF